MNYVKHLGLGLLLCVSATAFAAQVAPVAASGSDKGYVAKAQEWFNARDKYQVAGMAAAVVVPVGGYIAYKKNDSFKKFVDERCEDAKGIYTDVKDGNGNARKYFVGGVVVSGLAVGGYLKKDWLTEKFKGLWGSSNAAPEADGAADGDGE